MIRLRSETMYAADKRERERRTDFFVYGIYRPISIAVTPAFLRLGATATGVTALNLLLAVAMPAVALALPRPYLWLALLVFACTVVDCVDGNIARATGSSSAVGQYLDSLAGKAYHLLLLVALAIVAASEVPDIGLGSWLTVALAGALLKIWSRESRAYFRLHFTDFSASFAPAAFSWKSLVFSSVKLIPFGLLALGPIGLVHLLLTLLVVVNSAAFLHTQRSIFRRLIVLANKGPDAKERSSGPAVDET